MKTLVLTCSLLMGIFSSLAAEIPTLPDEIRQADLVAIVKVTDVSKTVVTNSSLSRITNYTAKAVVERSFKGSPGQIISIRDDDRVPHFQDGLAFKYVVFLKRVGQEYEPLDRYCVTGVFGRDPAEPHVGWSWGCPTLKQAVTTIEKIVAKQSAEKH